MTDGERLAKIFTLTPFKVAITDPYLSQIRITVGNARYELDSGSIPFEVRMGCDRPKGEEEMQL